MGKVIYFAYGSNLDRFQLERRVGDFEVVGVGYIDDYVLAFNKRGIDGTSKANIVIAPKNKTWGVFYRITEKQMSEMARFEGGYSRIFVDGQLTRNIGTDGYTPTEPIRAQTFISGAIVDKYPSETYKERIIVGMIEWGLPPGLIDRLDEVRTQKPVYKYTKPKSNGSKKW
jgi:hypothetical protein